MYEAKYRDYDAQIGRFMQIDPKTANAEGWSVYAGMLDNPVLHSDPLGDSAGKPKPPEPKPQENPNSNSRFGFHPAAPGQYQTEPLKALMADGTYFLAKLFGATDVETAVKTVTDKNASTEKKVVAVTNAILATARSEEGIGGEAKTPVGTSDSQLKIVTQNSPTTIAGVDFSGHALDKMQSSGINSPTAVIDATKNATTTMPGNTPGTTVHVKDNLKVVTNSDGKIITVIRQ